MRLWSSGWEKTKNNTTDINANSWIKHTIASLKKNHPTFNVEEFLSQLWEKELSKGTNNSKIEQLLSKVSLLFDSHKELTYDTFTTLCNIYLWDNYCSENWLNISYKNFLKNIRYNEEIDAEILVLACDFFIMAWIKFDDTNNGLDKMKKYLDIVYEVKQTAFLGDYQKRDNQTPILFKYYHLIFEGENLGTKSLSTFRKKVLELENTLSSSINGSLIEPLFYDYDYWEILLSKALKKDISISKVQRNKVDEVRRDIQKKIIDRTMSFINCIQEIHTQVTYEHSEHTIDIWEILKKIKPHTKYMSYDDITSIISKIKRLSDISSTAYKEQKQYKNDIAWLVYTNLTTQKSEFRNQFQTNRHLQKLNDTNSCSLVSCPLWLILTAPLQTVQAIHELNNDKETSERVWGFKMQTLCSQIPIMVWPNSLSTYNHEYQHMLNEILFPYVSNNQVDKFTKRLSDEIIAYIRDGSEYKDMERILTRPKNMWWLYDYSADLEKTPDNIKDSLAFDEKRKNLLIVWKRIYKLLPKKKTTNSSFESYAQKIMKRVHKTQNNDTQFVNAKVRDQLAYGTDWKDIREKILTLFAVTPNNQWESLISVLENINR